MSTSLEPPAFSYEAAHACFSEHERAQRDARSRPRALRSTSTGTTNGIIAPNADGTTPSGTLTPTVTFDASLMRAFLLSLLPPVMGVSKEELVDSLFDAEFEERVSRFASEGGGPLYVVKVKGEGEGA